MNRKPGRTRTSGDAALPPEQPPPTADDIGYGRPPKRTQFKPGHSGNPKGRPKGARNLASQVRTVLGRRIAVVEHGQRRFVSAGEAILHRFLELALKGDVRAAGFLMSLYDRTQPTDTEEPANDVLSEQDKAIMANLFKGIQTPRKE